MSKRFLAMILATSLCVSSITAVAKSTVEQEYLGLNAQYNLKESLGYKLSIDFAKKSGEILVKGFEKKSKDSFALYNVKIPHSINTRTVTKIADNAFNGVEDIGTVSIPRDVNSVGTSAFESCEDLFRVRFLSGSSLNIGKGVFKNCKNLQEVQNFSIASNTLADTFVGCIKLGYIHLGENVTELQRTFEGCTSLKKVAFPWYCECRLQVIGKDTFKGCSSLESIELPASLQVIEKNAFKGCKEFTFIRYAGTKAQWKKTKGRGYLPKNIHVNCTDGTYVDNRSK